MESSAKRNYRRPRLIGPEKSASLARRDKIVRLVLSRSLFLIRGVGLPALTSMTIATNPVLVQPDRRRGSRAALGLPVTLHMRGRPRRLTVEIVDVSTGGVRLLAPGDTFRVGERGSLHFVLSEGRICVAEGHVLRVDESGGVVLALDEANAAFLEFLAALTSLPAA